MYKYIKRILDIIISILSLIILFIPLMILSIIIKLKNKGPILYKQLRTGYKGKNFYIYKFRTLNNKNDINNFSIFLRKTSLDELPQLINVLKGNMSLIGPRPWITNYYDNFNDYQKKRLDVLPGITGLAQVSGRNNLNVFEKIDKDLKYVNNYSFILDLKIFLLTIMQVFKQDGADITQLQIEKEINDLKK